LVVVLIGLVLVLWRIFLRGETSLRGGVVGREIFGLATPGAGIGVALRTTWHLWLFREVDVVGSAFLAAEASESPHRSRNDSVVDLHDIPTARLSDLSLFGELGKEEAPGSLVRVLFRDQHLNERVVGELRESV
jgi:hypothetical protein